MSRERVIVIGAGLGGLPCGVILDRSGYQDTFLEQDSSVGGCLRCFRRDGVSFETGMHYIGSADAGQPLHALFRFLGVLPVLRLQRLDESAYDIVSLEGRRFAFANGREAFIETLLKDFPDARPDLERYVAAVGEVADQSSLAAALGLAPPNTSLAVWQSRPLYEVLAELTTNPLLASVLAGRIPLIAARRGVTPFSLHAFITAFYSRSAFRIVGGSQVLARLMADAVRAAGGVIHTATRVTAITAGVSGVSAVRTAGGECLQADVVISTVHPSLTLSFLDTPFLRPAFRQRISGLPQTSVFLTLYLKFRDGTVPYMNRNFFSYARAVPWDCETYDAMTWPKGYLYMHSCHEPFPRFARSASVISYLSYGDVAAWDDAPLGRRGADYEAFKREHAERLLKALERDFPGITSCVERYWTSTPLTWRDYTGTPGGAMYGVAADCRTGIAGRVPVAWRLPGLFQAGQSVNSHGILGTLLGSLQACFRFPAAREYILRHLFADDGDVVRSRQ